MEFKIKEGNHYHSNWIARLYTIVDILYDTQNISKRVMMTEKAWYPKSYVRNSGWNKLFGGGAIAHQNRSARYVWQPDFDNIGQYIIAGYVYERGDWTAYPINDFKMFAGQWEDMIIDIVNDGYLFTYPGGSLLVPHRNPSLRKPLWPYNGGLDYACRTYSIYLK